MEKHVLPKAPWITTHDSTDSTVLPRCLFRRLTSPRWLLGEAFALSGRETHGTWWSMWQWCTVQAFWFRSPAWNISYNIIVYIVQISNVLIDAVVLGTKSSWQRNSLIFTLRSRTWQNIVFLGASHPASYSKHKEKREVVMSYNLQT